jgi:hypothetical protein
MRNGGITEFKVRFSGLSNRKPVLIKYFYQEVFKNVITPTVNFNILSSQYHLLFYCVKQGIDFHQFVHIQFI